jgi:hypothetical protein
MPTVVGIDTFKGTVFASPPYKLVTGTPVRDTGVVREQDPASMKLAATGSAIQVNYPDIPSGNGMIWNGVGYRLDSIDTGDTDIMQAFTVAGSGSHVVAFASATNLIYHYITGGASFPSVAYTFANWVWIEQIFDVSTATRGGYCRVNDTDLTSVTLASTSSTGLDVSLRCSGHTLTAYYSLHLWGYAASTSDWYGKNAALALLPAVNAFLEHSTAVSVSQQFTMPWENVGSASSSALGSILSTQSVARVFDFNSPPLVTDDSSLGYAVGDVWIRNPNAYLCVSAAVGNAVWKQVA